MTELKIMICLAAADYNERFHDMYTFSELISNIRKVEKIDSRKMQGQSAFKTNKNKQVTIQEIKKCINVDYREKWNKRDSLE